MRKRFFLEIACVVDEKLGGKVVCAVDHKIILTDHLPGIVGHGTLGIDSDNRIGIDCPDFIP